MRFSSRKSFIEFVELVRSLGYELTSSSRGYATILLKLPIFKLEATIETKGKYFTITLSKGSKTEIVVTLEKVGKIWRD